jgi:hypothetical protein
VLLFPFGQTSMPDDMWSLDVEGRTPWVRTRTGGSPPSPASVRWVFYDRDADRVIAVASHAGGGSAGTNTLGTWALPLSGSGGWSLLPATQEPLDRGSMTPVFDSRRNQYLIFEGQSFQSEERQEPNEAWTLVLAADHVTWAPLSIDNPFANRHWGVGSAYDPVSDRVFLLGGGTQFANGSRLDGVPQLLALTLSPSPHWSTLEPFPSAAGTGSAPPIFVDVAARRMFVARYDSLWSYDLDNSTGWSGSPLEKDSLGGFGTTLFPTTAGGQAPLAWNDRGRLLRLLRDRPARWDVVDDQRARVPVVVYPAVMQDPVRGSWLLFGGSLGGILGSPAPTNEVWRFDPRVSPQWALLTVGGEPPPPTYQASIAFDPVGMRWIVAANASPSPDLWALELSPTLKWTRLTTAPGGPPTLSGSLVCDPARNSLLSFGGRQGQAESNDLWRLNLSTLQWSQVQPRGPLPHGRWAASAVIDPARDRLLIFGGASHVPYNELRADARNDSWSISLRDSSAWESLAVAPGPSRRSQADAFFDPARSSLAIIGGTGFPYRVYLDSEPYNANPWLMPLSGLPEWTRSEDTIGSPLQDNATEQGAFDVDHDRFLALRTNLQDAWILDRGHPTHIALLDLSPGDATNTLRPDAHGLVTCAILSNAAFDARTVDPASVTLAGASTHAAAAADRATMRDVNGDGRLDRVLKFARADMTLDPTVDVVALAGRTQSGEAVVGWDLYRLDASAGAGSGGRIAGGKGVSPAGDPDAPSTGVVPAHLGISFAGAVRGAATVRLALPHAASDGVIEIFAVDGRRVARRELGAIEAGERTIALGETAMLASGVYFARVRVVDETAHARFVVLH